jgi:hypothetical protein
MTAFPGDHVPTTVQRCTAAELLEEWGIHDRDDPVGPNISPGNISVLVDYLADLCAKDDVAQAQKTALHYMDLTGWYRLLAVLHT